MQTMERARTMLKNGLQTITGITLFSFIIPSMLHYTKNEILMSFLVGGVWFALLLYHAFIFHVTHPTLKKHFDAWRLHLHILILVLYILLAFGFVFQGLQFRPDITSIMVGLYFIWRGFDICELPPDHNWNHNMRFLKWCLYLQAMLLGNLLLRDVSHFIGVVDFAKGFFWGAIFVNIENERWWYKSMMRDILNMAHIQMAPFKKN